MSVSRVSTLLSSAVLGAAVFGHGGSASAKPGGTIGLVLTDIRYALYETPGAKEECPDGLQVGENEQFKADPNHLAHLAKFGGTTQNRGPGGELPAYVPLAVEDPIPFRELKTTVGYGLNLDGTQDGRATAKTVKHEKFNSPDGEKVDNQVARVLGCVMGWRKTGFMAEFHSKEIETQPYNRFLIEITGVDDEVNDPQVQVTVYKGIDRLVRTPDGQGFLPFMSHRIDRRAPELMFTTTGRIADGVLTTDPIPEMRMTMRQVEILTERRVLDARFRLKLGPDGATGMLGGYERIENWWNTQSKLPGTDVGRYSGAALYRAALRYADGYPDPATGRATAISVGYRISTVRALIVHPGSTTTRVASTEK
jgi:hypothetical protein